MARNFYTGTEAERASGSANVVSIVSPSPESFGLTSSQIASYSALAGSFNDAFTLSVTPGTRTPVAIAQKRTLKRQLKTASATLGKIIVATPTVSDAQLASLRMNARLSPRRRDVPASAPVVRVISVVGRVVTIRVKDPTSQMRGLPFGASGANLYSFVGNSPPDDPREYHHQGLTTRARTQIVFPNDVASGATVWLSACWVSKRGETSIASVPMRFTIQGGAIAASA